MSALFTPTPALRSDITRGGTPAGLVVPPVKSEREESITSLCVETFSRLDQLDRLTGGMATQNGELNQIAEENAALRARIQDQQLEIQALKAELEKFRASSSAPSAGQISEKLVELYPTTRKRLSQNDFDLLSADAKKEQFLNQVPYETMDGLNKKIKKPNISSIINGLKSQSREYKSLFVPSISNNLIFDTETLYELAKFFNDDEDCNKLTLGVFINALKNAGLGHLGNQILGNLLLKK
ncbi:MAG: hypothetical protein ACHQUC_05660 [Chlamydiales bacterium]